MNRPTGSNADEWHLYLSQCLCVRPNEFTGSMEYVALAICDAIDEARIIANHYSMEEATQLLKDAVEDERDRCAAIVNGARFESADLRSIVSRIRDPNYKVEEE